MKILAIDTSGQTVSAAVVDEYITLGEITVSARMRHSEILLSIIDRLFALSGDKLEDMDAIACVCGPGSFTGLRIGAATAMGLARGAGAGLIPVPTLDALAYNIGFGIGAGPALVMPMLDARRGQVYTALYKSGGLPGRVSEYMAVSVQEALELLESQTAVFLGDGAAAYEADIRALCPCAVFALQNQNRQRAASAGTCAMYMLKNGFEPRPGIELLYIRKPQAVREREERERGRGE